MLFLSKKSNMLIITAMCCFFIAPKLPLTGRILPLTACKLPLTTSELPLTSVWKNRNLLFFRQKEQFAVFSIVYSDYNMLKNRSVFEIIGKGSDPLKKSDHIWTLPKWPWTPSPLFEEELFFNPNFGQIRLLFIY